MAASGGGIEFPSHLFKVYSAKYLYAVDLTPQNVISSVPHEFQGIVRHIVVIVISWLGLLLRGEIFGWAIYVGSRMVPPYMVSLLEPSLSLQVLEYTLIQP